MHDKVPTTTTTTTTTTTKRNTHIYLTSRLDRRTGRILKCLLNFKTT